MLLSGYSEALVPGVFHHAAETPYHVQGYIDIRLGHQFALYLDERVLLGQGGGQQERREVLAGNIAANRYLAADQSVGVYPDGRVALGFQVLDPGADLGQRIHQVFDRALPQTGFSGDGEFPFPQA